MPYEAILAFPDRQGFAACVSPGGLITAACSASAELAAERTALQFRPEQLAMSLIKI
jgi:hypothetical protein